jgi:TPR repeat protein
MGAMGSSAFMMRLAACIAVALALAGARAARADSADLQWQYDCLRNADAVCYDATPTGTDPLSSATASVAPSPKDDGTAPSAAAGAAEPAALATGKGKAPANAATKTASAAPPDPLAALAARLQARKPTPADMATLQSRAAAHNPRALELLAWAELTGVGVPRDPVQAYFIYGMAAAAGVATGLRDQAAIFEGALTDDERQQVLVIENGHLAHDQH